MENKQDIYLSIINDYLPMILLIVILGINLMYFEYLRELETGTRIIHHMILTFSMVVAFFLGLPFRIKRFKKRFLPLLKRIQKFKNAVKQ